MIAFFVACFGLLLGSFFNVLIWRIPRGESIVLPPSHCPACGRMIKPLENVPILSFLALRGRCAGCKQRISPRYPAVELATAIAALLLWHLLIVPRMHAPHSPWETALLVVQTASLLVLIPVSIIDLDHYIIPDSFTLPGLAIGIAASFMPGGITPLQCLLGILAGGGSLLAVGKLGEVIFRKDEAMGGGDVKLMAFLGALWGWKAALVGIVFGSFLGAAIGGGLMLARLLPKDRRIPFGPFLGVGVWTAVIAGDKILSWYFNAVEHLFFK